MFDLKGKILHFQNCGNRITNVFALVVAETEHLAYIKNLPQIRTYEDKLKYRGTSVPDTSKLEQFKDLPKKELLRAKKHLNEDGSLNYIASYDNAFSLWDGEPKGFDHLD